MQLDGSIVKLLALSARLKRGHIWYTVGSRMLPYTIKAINTYLVTFLL